MRSVFLAFFLLVPMAGFASQVYTFSEAEPNGGTIGFSLTTPNFIQTDQSGLASFDATQFTSCDASGLPAYTCVGAEFRQDYGSLLTIDVALRELNSPGPGFSDVISDNFHGANILGQDGTTNTDLFTPSGKTATLMVSELADLSPAPEPESIGVVLVGAAGVLVWKRKRLIS